jgi:hypothetical protein
MYLSHVKRAAALAASFALAAAANAAVVPITYQSQDRSVSVTSSATGFPRGGTSTTPQTDNQNQSQQAPDLNNFNGNAAVSSTEGLQTASATASQQSTLGPNGFAATGSVLADSNLGGGQPASATSASLFQISFNVNQAESYTLNASLSSDGDPADPAANQASIALTNAAGQDPFAPITSVKAGNVQIQGTLAPGAYEFTLSAQAMSNDANQNFVNYGVSLADGPAPISGIGSNSGPGGINQGPAPVPLPSSGMISLTMLAALAAADWLRRKRRAWLPM